MIFDIESMILPSGNVGGEFVCKVLVAGLLSELDAGAPYNGWILGGGLWFDSEREAEKIPVGFNFEKSFAKVNKDGNVANGVWVEVMELKAVVVKEATEKRTRGEGQTPFGKLVKYDDFVNIFHGERITKRRAPIDKILVLELWQNRLNYTGSNTQVLS
jgi:hypothetical protein